MTKKKTLQICMMIRKEKTTPPNGISKKNIHVHSKEVQQIDDNKKTK